MKLRERYTNEKMCSKKWMRGAENKKAGISQLF